MSLLSWFTNMLWVTTISLRIYMLELWGQLHLKIDPSLKHVSCIVLNPPYGASYIIPHKQKLLLYTMNLPPTNIIFNKI